jgi:LEA14-like dessication related protein
VRFFLVLVLIFSLAGCLPFRSRPSAGETIDRAEPIAPIEPLILSSSESVIERFDPPGPDSSSNLELTLKTTAQNINPFAVTLTRIDYDLFLQDRKVTSGSFTPNLQVAANTQEPLTLALNTTLERNDLIKAAAQTYAGTPLPFRLEGTLSFTSNSYGFTTRKLVLLTGQLTLTESSVFTLREGVPIIRVVIEAQNPGDVGYFLYGKDLEVFLNNVPLAKQDVSPLPVQAGQTSSFELLFYPDTADLGNEATITLEAALGGTETLVDVRGQLFIDVLGVDTFEIADWSVTGSIVN